MDRKNIVLIALAFLSVLCLITVTTCINLKELRFSPDDEAVLQIMKEELDEFRVEMTKSFMETHSRQKRAAAGTVADIDIKQKFVEIVVEPVGPFSTFTFEGVPYVIRKTGIYKLDAVMEIASGKEVSAMFSPRRDAGMVRMDVPFNLKENEIVLDGFEWRHSFFILTSTGKFSTIYTMHDQALTPIFRQRIHNKGDAVLGKFFEFNRNLYMIIANDNDAHTTTFSPIFRWTKTYMDEIHQVQTTGTSALETFEINGKQYIAIAQSKDSNGNTLLGTIVLKMDHLERLERVQLLWSNGANSLHYMHHEKEHFLVVGQEKEPAIAYWFGGMDFISWQQFDGIQGANLKLNGYQMTADEPVLITSDGGIVKFFTRSASATNRMTTWVQSKTFDSISTQVAVAPDTKEETSKIQFFHVVAEDGSEKTFLEVTKKFSGANLESKKFHLVELIDRPLTVSWMKETGDKLSQCLQTLSMTLDDSQPILNRISEEGPKVLTRDKNVNFEGTLTSTRIVKMDPGNSKVTKAQITPDLQRSGSDAFSTPSQLLSKLGNSNDQLELMKSDLKNVFFKQRDKTNIVTGNLNFRGPVQISNLQASNATSLRATTINNVVWDDLQNFALKTKSEDPQIVDAPWTLDSIEAEKVTIVKQDSKFLPENFMLKSCTESQTIAGHQQFEKSLTISEMKVEPETTINGIPFAQIALNENQDQEIAGFKHVSFVKGNFEAENVNDKNLMTWLSSVARLTSTQEQHFTGPVTFADSAELQIEKMNVDEVNNRNWNEFTENVMLQGKDQQVEGFMEFTTIRVDNLQANFISGTKSENLLTSNTTQDIKSHFINKNVEILGPLTTNIINGASLKDAVTKNEDRVTINGVVVLENFSVKDIFMAEDMTIAGQDVSMLPRLNKVHSYSTADGSPIVLKNVNVNTLTTQFINNANLDDFRDKYWSKTRANLVTSPQLVLEKNLVTVLNDKFETHRLNLFSFPDEFVSLDQREIVMNTPFKFERPVTVLGDVTMVDGAKIGGIDMSEVQSIMVDKNFKGKIRGEKTFSQKVIAQHGATFGNLNDIDLVKDAVLLNEESTQTIQGILDFKGDVMTENFNVRDGNVDVNGMVNDIKLDELGQTTVYKDKENVIEGDIEFQKGVHAEQFSTQMLNKINVGDIMSNMILLNSPENQTIEDGIVINKGNVEFSGDSLTGSINGENLSGYLSKVVRLDFPPTEIIKGRKVFNNVITRDQISCSTFGEVDLTELQNNALSRTKAQTITGHWSLADANFQENLETNNIGNIAIDNIVFTNEPFEISSPIAFTSGSTVKGPLKVTGDLNGITFDENLKNVLTINDVHEFDHVSINGDLDWENNRPEIQRLSYLFKNAVTNSEPQRIFGKVQFLKGFQASDLSTGKWLGDVNLQSIEDDALKRDDSNWVIAGNNLFDKPLRIEDLFQPVNTLGVTEVNGFNLEAMNNDIVKTNDDQSTGRMVQGKKILKGAVFTDNLDVLDKISDVSVSDFVVKGDTREINQVHFKDIKVKNNVDFATTEGIDFNSLINDRVSLSKPDENLRGNFAFQDVNVVNKCNMPMINNIKEESVLRRDMQSLPTVTGQKTLKEKLTIVGEMETESLNGHSIQELMDSTLRVDRDEVINRPVIFQRPVMVNQEINLKTVNDVHLETFSSKVSERVARLIDDAQSPGILEEELLAQTERLRKVTQDRTSWLEYLRLKKDWTDMGVKARVGSVMKRHFSGEIFVSFIENVVNEGENTQVPKGCACNKVETVIFKESDLDANKVKMVGEDRCLQIFHVQSPAGKIYSVFSDSLSTNASCIAKEEDTTRILTESQGIANLKLGQVSDVGVFSDKGKDFLVIAQNFDRNSRSHTTTTKIFRVNSNGLLDHVQDIETHGARKIALSQVNNRWMLAVANSKNAEDDESCSAESAIYEWSQENDQFLLLRNVMTDGVFDVTFISSEASSEFYKQSFVAFAQEGNAATGEIMIMKYDQMERNFVMSQTIRSNWPVTSLRSTCLCQQCFLMISVPQEGVTFYENRFVEGFQPYYKAPVSGALDIMHLTASSKNLFAIATTKGPILAEGVLAGSCGAN